MLPAPRHTFVVSDVHIADGEAIDDAKPFWRRYKAPEHFIDATFIDFLDHLRELAGDHPAELVLNGDIFDFDCVLVVPDDADFSVSWLERARGLSAEEEKSAWKLRRILDDHPRLLAALRAWVEDGHDLVYVIGNHDMEMHWPAAQDVLRAALELPEDRASALRFCAWFYVSSDDTLITHGNQLDPYCLCHDPLHPFIELDGRIRVRLPFGDHAGKLLSNGIGWFNPHVESTFVKPLHEWIIFFYRHVLRHQPLILWTWLWSSVAALVKSLREGFRPAMRDPLSLEQRVQEVSQAARASPAVVRAMHAVRVHPAVFRPLKVARELWLDRAFLLLAVAVGSIQAASTLHLFAGISAWWGVALFALLLPPVLFYAARVDSDVQEVDRNIRRQAPLLARIAGVEHVITGHTHRAEHLDIQGVHAVNTGAWAPGFEDMACTVPYGIRGFAWLAPHGDQRRVQLRRWTGSASEPIEQQTYDPSPLERLRDRIRSGRAERRKAIAQT